LNSSLHFFAKGKWSRQTTRSLRRTHWLHAVSPYLECGRRVATSYRCRRVMEQISKTASDAGSERSLEANARPHHRTSSGVRLERRPPPLSKCSLSVSCAGHTSPVHGLHKPLRDTLTDLMTNTKT
jgi:hypothetical protein